MDAVHPNIRPDDSVMLRKQFIVEADPLKMAYVMLTSGLYQKCELAWFNSNPLYYDARYIAPRDIIVGDVLTADTVATYEDVCAARAKHGARYYSCICALDETDVERIALAHINDDESVSRIGIFMNGSHRHYDDYAQSIITLLSENYCSIFTG